MSSVEDIFEAVIDIEDSRSEHEIARSFADALQQVGFSQVSIACFVICHCDISEDEAIDIASVVAP